MLQFQFDHTRRVVDARSRIDAIQTGPVENYSLRLQRKADRVYVSLGTAGTYPGYGPVYRNVPW